MPAIASKRDLVSIDGRGVATLHFPDDVDPTALAHGGAMALDHSYELDDAPGFERFLRVTAGQRLPLDAGRCSPRRGPSRAAPAAQCRARASAGVTQSVIVLSKR